MPLSIISNSACHGSARLTMTVVRFCFFIKLESIHYKFYFYASAAAKINEFPVYHPVSKSGSEGTDGK
jgi:hypothetical protein